MRMIKLSYINFKNSFKNYMSLIISLAFAIAIFFDFQSVIYSDAFKTLGTRNTEYIKMVTIAVTFVLGCFLFFFIWYSTNVFLTRRKKEIGIYIFMGLTNQKIGKMYAFEIIMLGTSALFTGLLFGVITQRLFQMILIAISDITVDIKFHLTWQPVLITTLIYLAIYLIFVGKGYINIIKSSVLEMISAAKQNEYVQQHVAVLLMKAVVGIIVTGTGFYFSMIQSAESVLSTSLAAVILVVVGVYFLFGGFIPLIFQSLAKRKKFLYKKQRCLWINNTIFRIRKNYRTYAMVSILMICSVTALACGFAMKHRCENIEQFRSTYTFQFLTFNQDIKSDIEKIINETNIIETKFEIPVLAVEGDPKLEWMKNATLVSYSDLKKLAENVELEFEIPELTNDEAVELRNLPLISLITDDSQLQTAVIQGKNYNQIKSLEIPYMGCLQENMNFYVVSDAEFQRLKPIGESYYLYNYRIGNLADFEQTKEALDAGIPNDSNGTAARISMNPNDTELAWIKVWYSLCIFMFMVFILASACIMFMKMYNDAFEEKSRYIVMQKMGCDVTAMKKSVASELAGAYASSFVVMVVASLFSVHALGAVMRTNLLLVNIVCVLIILLIFMICYMASIVMYWKNANIIV